MKSLKSIIKADYLQRTRSYAFLITLLVSVGMAYAFAPPQGANYSTLRIGDFIGESNAAWIGHVTAIMASVFLWLFGFYLVNNGIKRDVETGVGQIVATTSISNFKYLFAKAFSNFLVLFTITLIVMLMAFCMVIIRGSNYTFDLMQFLLPYLLATIPSIFCVSVLAVFAEVVFGKYTNFQNVAFFFLFPSLIGITAISHNPSIFCLDVLGTKHITDGMLNLVNMNFHQNIDKISTGFIFVDQSYNKYFLFEGSQWPAIYIISRILWIGVAFLLLYIASRLFHRFDTKERVANKKEKKNTDTVETRLALKEIHLSALPVASPEYGIWPFVKTELLMLLRIGPKWFWLVNIGGFIALFFMPLPSALQIGLPVLWFLQINRWAGIATKEKYNRTHYFAYAAYKPLTRLLTSQILAGALLAIAFAFPLIIRFLILGDYSTAASIVLGAIFVISLSVSTGILFGGKRFFEIAFFMLTYANVSLVPGLDYFGAFNYGISYIALIFCINCALLFGAFIFRRYEIRNQ